MNVNLKSWIPVHFGTYPGETSLLLLAEKAYGPEGEQMLFYVGYCKNHQYFKYNGVYGAKYDRPVKPQYYIVLGALADFHAPEMG